MTMNHRERRVITPLPATTPEIGRWLWALEDTRVRTKRAVEGLSQAEVDWLDPAIGNSIGTLLYHIALIEADYLCIDILERENYFPGFQAILPYPVRDEQDRLTAVTGVPLLEHVARLDTIRHRLLAIMSEMREDDLYRVRTHPGWPYEITPAWTLHHLMQHEGQHRGEIGTIRSLARRTLGASPDS